MFVVDGTYSTDPVLKALKLQIEDNATEFRHEFGERLSVKIGVVVFRDPVDRPADQNEYLNLTDSREEVSIFLDGIKSYGGRDEQEDWAGGLELALEKMNWRGGLKIIFWISDANAHGSRFSLLKRDPHEEEAERLVFLVEEMARKNISFMGVNIRKGEDPGCAQTFNEMKKIYKVITGSSASFKTVNFDVAWQPEDDGDDPFKGDDWPASVMSRFRSTYRHMFAEAEAEAEAVSEYEYEHEDA